MNFKEIVEATMNKCNVDSDDLQAIEIIKLAINDGYKEIAKVEKIVTTAKVPIIMGKATLPENISELIKVSPSLLAGDKIEGRTIITSLTDKILDITYSYFPDELVNDTDIPEITPKYHSALVNYGCFGYYQFKKKIEIANAYLMSFNRNVESVKFEKDQASHNFIEVVYSI